MTSKMTEAIPSQEVIKVMYTPEVIHSRIRELAIEIAGAKMHDLLVVAVLKGSFVFAADLIRALHSAGMGPQVDFLSLSSYREGTVSTGRVTILRDIDIDVTDRDVLLVDDILDSGRTLHFAKGLLEGRGARRLTTCVLLDKPAGRVADIRADFIAFHCPDQFVVGYGMDKAYRYRELPFVGFIDSS